MNICEHLTATARIVPDQTAIRFDGHSISYAQLEQLSGVAAAALRDADVSRGDRVAIMLPNVPAFAVWYYAVLRVGGIAVSISTRAAAAEMKFLLNDCGATVFVTDAQSLERVAESLPESICRTIASNERGDAWEGRNDSEAPSATWADMEPDDPAVILYTSGTTGFAKGATLSHRNVRTNVDAFNHLCNMQPHDRILLAVPLFHCFGQNALLNSALNVGATLILQRQFDLNETRRLLVNERVTQLYGVPMMFQLLLNACQPADLPEVNYCFSAAATLPLQLSEQWREKFKLPVCEGYGLTETSPFASYNHRIRFVPGTIGTPIDGVEMKVVDVESGRECPPGVPGEIIIRGPNVMLGYWGREEETQAAIRNGWFHSGDIGHVDEAGYFRIVDRLKDMIAVGGLKVFPAEVERVLLDHPSVRDVAVVGIPNDVFGEQVVAFVVLHETDGGTHKELETLRRYAQQQLANYKVPRLLLPLEELPRNPSGKVLKRELREFDIRSHVTVTAADDAEATPADIALRPVREPRLRSLLERTFPSGRPQVATQFLQELVQEIASLPATPPPEARLLEIGMDSLMIVELSNQIQAELGPQQEVSATLAFDYPRIGDLAAFLADQLDETKIQQTTRGIAGSGPPLSEDLSDESQRQLEAAIDAMTEEEALRELMQELEER
jgi:long-chain acyl-CoA synthetase